MLKQYGCQQYAMVGSLEVCFLGSESGGFSRVRWKVGVRCLLSSAVRPQQGSGGISDSLQFGNRIVLCIPWVFIRSWFCSNFALWTNRSQAALQMYSLRRKNPSSGLVIQLRLVRLNWVRPCICRVFASVSTQWYITMRRACNLTIIHGPRE